MGTDRLKGAAASVDDPSTEAAAPFLYPKNRKQTLRRYLLRQFCKITGRHGYQRIISVVNHKSRCAAGGFPDVFSLDIVDLHFIIGASLGIPCCQGSGLFKYPIGKLFPFCFYNYMRARNPLCMEPPVSAVCQFKGKLFILIVVFAYIDMEAVAGQIMERTAGYFGRFSPARRFFTYPYSINSSLI